MELLVQLLVILQPVIYLAITTAIAFLAPKLYAFLTKQKEKLQAEIDSDKADRIVDMLTEMVWAAVMKFQQIMVDGLKEQNAFTIEKQKEVFELAFQEVMKQITPEAMQILRTVFGDVEGAIRTLLEAQVKAIKLQAK